METPNEGSTVAIETANEIEGGGNWRTDGPISISESLPPRNPDVRPGLFFDHALDFVIDLLEAVTFHNSCMEDKRIIYFIITIQLE